MQTNRFLGATLLIAGTAIGAGMLALPVSTAAYGFLPSLFLLIICWFLLMTSALLVLEVNLWLKPESNIISMAKQTLGLGGQIIAWIAYLLLLYALLAAYLTGLNSLITSTLSQNLHIHSNAWLIALVIIFIFGFMLYLGTRQVDYFNRIFVTGKIITYLILLALISPHIQIKQLMPTHMDHMWLALPIVVTSYGFHTVIPGLRIYLNNNIQQLRKAIIIGSTAPLIVYIFWEILILGAVPTHGPHGLLSILKSGQPGTELASSLDILFNSTSIYTVFKFFTFFAITTSFTGVSFSLFGFLADGFHIKLTSLGRLMTIGLTFIPPVIFAMFYPHGFIVALGYAGICTAILLALLPALMAWSGRYVKNIATGYRVFGGKITLGLIALFAVLVMVVELLPTK